MQDFLPGWDVLHYFVQVFSKATYSVQLLGRDFAFGGLPTGAEGRQPVAVLVRSPSLKKYGLSQSSNEGFFLPECTFFQSSSNEDRMVCTDFISHLLQVSLVFLRRENS